jgi:calcium-dependent protein kinase
MNHKWFSISHTEKASTPDRKIFQRLKDFRAPQRLQFEALTFIVNNINKDIDFKSLREAFRALDKNNTGLLSLNEIKEGFRESMMP